MSRFDITCCKLLLIVGGMVLVLAELCLLLDAVLTGTAASPVLSRALLLVAGLLVVVLALRVQRR